MATTPRTADVNAGASRAFLVLRFGFTILPIIAGIDKFFDYLTNWDQYLAPIVVSTSHLGTHAFMQIVGGIEIVAGLVVAVFPRIGGYIVALWLAGIIGNLCLNPNHYWDVAARDFGLFLGAISLGFLAEWAARRPAP
ncbi:MAG TPA: hypothetical protein VG944_12935 [Fimbriimonas sp.]|nr:hypothetical protein [Fimbriimonas sp.]